MLQNIMNLDAKLQTLSTLQTTKYLLGWNEPDRADQANISPTLGANMWYNLEVAAKKYNLQLGGPAIGSTPSWQDQWFRVRPARGTSGVAVLHLGICVVPWLRVCATKGMLSHVALQRGQGAGARHEMQCCRGD